MSFLNGQSSLGRSTCYVTLDNGATCMICANYTSGDVVIYPVDSEGRIGEATHRVQHSGGSIRSDRQEGPHPHAAVIAPGGRFVFIPDLGLDQIKSYEIDYRNYRLLPHRDVQVQPGAGPRHMVFHSTIHFAYVINELDNTISAFAYAEPDGTLNPVQTVPALPGNFTGSSTCADIYISPSGSFLYGSNRGHDSIVVYKINKSDGTLTYVEHVSTLGRTPRNFALTPDGRFLLAANQDSDSIVTFHIDPQTGRLQAAGQSVSVAKPVCIKIMK